MQVVSGHTCFRAKWFEQGGRDSGLEWQWGASRTTVSYLEAPLQGVW